MVVYIWPCDIQWMDCWWRWCSWNSESLLPHLCVFQLQQQQNRLMKINHDLRHKITVVEAQGKALIEQKVELEAFAQARQQELVSLRQEVSRLRERLQGETKSPETEEPPAPPSPAQVRTKTTFSTDGAVDIAISRYKAWSSLVSLEH